MTIILSDGNSVSFKIHKTIISSDAEHINELLNEISDIIPPQQIKYWLTNKE